VLRLTSEVASAVNGRRVVVKSLVLLVARAIGPGPLRLKLIKFTHDLDDRHVSRIAA
jgi:hypothetical protein